MRDIIKTIRFTTEEFSDIEGKLFEHDLNFSEFSRATILNTKVKTNLTKDLIYHLSKIGNNLNQIAKQLNTKKSDLPNSKVIKVLIDIQSDLKNLK